MATFSADFWALKLTLTETETKEVETAADIGATVSDIVSKAAGAALVAGIPVTLIAGLVTGYLTLENKLVAAVDQGNGVTLNLPWLAIYDEQFWLIYPTPVSVHLQEHWQWCNRCDALYFAGSASGAGVCPTGGAHGPNTSSNYKLVMDVPGYQGQHDWRWCEKCFALYAGAGQPQAGQCPAGGAHSRGPSSDYALVMNNPSFSGQHGWRFCGKCFGLFWVWQPAITTGGVCPAGGAHERTVGTSDYALMS